MQALAAGIFQTERVKQRGFFRRPFERGFDCAARHHQSARRHQRGMRVVRDDENELVSALQQGERAGLVDARVLDLIDQHDGAVAD